MMYWQEFLTELSREIINYTIESNTYHPDSSIYMMIKSETVKDLEEEPEIEELEIEEEDIELVAETVGCEHDWAEKALQLHNNDLGEAVEWIVENGAK